jgi:hypothetical protein
MIDPDEVVMVAWHRVAAGSMMSDGVLLVNINLTVAATAALGV